MEPSRGRRRRNRGWCQTSSRQISAKSLMKVATLRSAELTDHAMSAAANALRNPTDMPDRFMYHPAMAAAALMKAPWLQAAECPCHRAAQPNRRTA